MYSFEELEVWKLARQLRNEVAGITKSFPKHEQFRLTDQMIRASRSVSANIAEGFGRFFYQENIQFCRQARGSLMELIDHLTVALDEHHIDNLLFQNMKDKILECNKVLNGYIFYLKKAKNGENSN